MQESKRVSANIRKFLQTTAFFVARHQHHIVPTTTYLEIFRSTTMEIAHHGETAGQSLVLGSTQSTELRTSKKARFKTKDKVRFRCFPDGSIQACVTVKSFTSTVLTEIDIARLWYTALECNQMALEAQEMATFLLATNGRYQKALETMLQASITNVVNGSTWAWQLEMAESEKRSRAKRRNRTPFSNVVTYEEALSLIAGAAARGLEPIVVKYLQTESSRVYRTCTEYSAAKTVSSYYQWRDCQHLTDLQKARLLAQHQRESSNIAVHFACALALGDANAVRKDFAVESLKGEQQNKEGCWCCSSPPRSVMDTLSFTEATDISLDFRKSRLLLSSESHEHCSPRVLYNVEKA